MIDQIKRSWAVVKKNLAIYYLKGPVLIFGMFMPAFMFLSFSLKRQISLEFLIPGLIGMALFFTVSSITPGIMPWETRMKTLERLTSTPISIWAIVLGDIFASFIYGFLITSVVYIICMLLLGKLIISLPLIIGTILAAFCFSSLGSLISVPPSDTPANTMMLATLIKFPLIFISGIFVPISEMGYFRSISYLSPLSYYTDILRNTIQGDGYFGDAINLLVLFVFSVILFTLSIKLHAKFIPKRI